MDDQTKQNIGSNVIFGVEIAGSIAQAAAPVVAIYNPVAGAAMGILGPVVESFVINETQMIMNLKPNVTKEEMIKLLEESKSAYWGIKPLETPEDIAQPEKES